MLLAQDTLDLDIGEAAYQANVPGALPDKMMSPDRGFGVFVSNIMGAIMVVASLLVLFYLIWGGIEWISAGDDKSKVEKARTRITQAVIGIIVLSSSYALYLAITTFLGLTS